MMELIKRLFITAFVKLAALLAGNMIILGGAFYLFIMPSFLSVYLEMPDVFALAVTIISLALLVWLTIRLYSQHLNYLLLLLGVIFLIGSGLCATSPPFRNSAGWGTFLLDIAVTLSGYMLWMTIHKKSPDS